MPHCPPRAPLPPATDHALRKRMATSPGDPRSENKQLILLPLTQQIPTDGIADLQIHVLHKQATAEKSILLISPKLMASNNIQLT